MYSILYILASVEGSRKRDRSYTPGRPRLCYPSLWCPQGAFAILYYIYIYIYTHISIRSLLSVAMATRRRVAVLTENLHCLQRSLWMRVLSFDKGGCVRVGHSVGSILLDPSANKRERVEAVVSECCTLIFNGPEFQSKSDYNGLGLLWYSLCSITTTYSMYETYSRITRNSTANRTQRVVAFECSCMFLRRRCM